MEKRDVFNPLRIARVTVAAGLLAWILTKIGWKPVVESLSGAKWRWVAVLTLLMFVELFLRTIRWRSLLQHIGIAVPIFPLFRRLWIANFANNFFPGQMGGDLWRILGRWDQPLKRAVVGSSVVVDRFSGLGGLLIFMTIMGFVRYSIVSDLNLTLFPMIGAPLSVLLLLLITIGFPPTAANWIIAKMREGRLKRIAGEFSHSLLIYAAGKGSLWRAIFISLLIHLTSTAIMFTALLALDQHPSYISVMFIVSFTTIISMVPITLNGLGVYEGVFVILCTHSGIGNIEAFSAALLARVLGTLMSSGGGILYMFSK